MRPGFEVCDARLPEFSLEAGSAPPGSVLAAVIGEHLFGWIELTHGPTENLQNVLGHLAAEHIGPDQKARVIVHEPDQVGIATA